MNEKYKDELSFRKIIPQRIQDIKEKDFDSKEEFCRIVSEEIYQKDEFNPVGYSALIILIKNLIKQELDLVDEENLSWKQIKKGIDSITD